MKDLQPCEIQDIQNDCEDTAESSIEEQHSIQPTENAEEESTIHNRGEPKVTDQLMEKYREEIKDEIVSLLQNLYIVLVKTLSLNTLEKWKNSQVCRDG